MSSESESAPEVKEGALRVRKRKRSNADGDWRNMRAKDTEPAEHLASQAHLSTEELVADVVRKFGGPQGSTYSAQPEFIAAVTMKPYQLDGLNWMLQLHARGGGGILGDDMGLGKTLQAIAFVASLLNEAHTRLAPFLVICPLSTVQNWMKEFSRFAPHIKVCRYMGPKEARAALREEVAGRIQAAPSSPRPFGDYAVVVTTSDFLILDGFFFSQFQFEYIVVDEAHRLKNPKGKLYQILMNDFAHSPRRLLLTGTPLQNNMLELWALLHFLHPRVFTDATTFATKWFPEATLRTKHAPTVTALQKLLSCLLLRRLKADVLADLPPKTEYLLFTPLSPMQRKFYKWILRKDAQSLFGSSKKSLQNVVMQLRKCCNHPYLFDGAEPEPFIMGDHIIKNSSKMVLLDKLLAHLFETGHKVLLFSQMTAMLDILQDYMDFKGYTYERLDGSVRGEDRFASVNKFQSDNDAFAFLLSTRAGGLGVTLTAADTVIFVDSDWNPQMDLQAQERAYRIGQTRDVTVYRLVCKSTIEDIMLKRAVSKLQLTGAVLQQKTALTDEDATNLVDMIKFGLASVLGTTADDADKSDKRVTDSQDTVYDAYLDLSIEELLASSERVSFAQPESKEKPKAEAASVYQYQGEDYRKKVAEETSAQDSAALSALLKAPQNTEDSPQPTRRGTLALERQPTVLETRKDKEERRIHRLQKKWERAEYTSFSLPSEEPSQSPPASQEEVIPDTAEEDTPFTIQHITGDVTKPVAVPGLDPTAHLRLIINCVNNSGSWGGGGMFRAIDRLSHKVCEVYEKAKDNQDLRLGDAHCVPVAADTWVVNVVVQRASTASSGSGGAVDMALLDSAFGKIQALISRLRAGQPIAGSEGSGSSFLRSPSKSFDPTSIVDPTRKSPSVHFPHFGEPKQWYTVERLIKKYFWGVPTVVYYYPRRHSPRHPAPATAPLPTPAVVCTAASSLDDEVFTRPLQTPAPAAEVCDADALEGYRVHIVGTFSSSHLKALQHKVLMHGGILADDLQPRPGLRDVVIIAHPSEKETLPPALTEVATISGPEWVNMQLGIS